MERVWRSSQISKKPRRWGSVSGAMAQSSITSTSVCANLWVRDVEVEITPPGEPPSLGFERGLG